MVAELIKLLIYSLFGCSLAKISMVAEPWESRLQRVPRCSLAKISMVAERFL